MTIHHESGSVTAEALIAEALHHLDTAARESAGRLGVIAVAQALIELGNVATHIADAVRGMEGDAMLCKRCGKGETEAKS